MPDEPRPLEDLAEDVLEGRPVDWISLESSPDPQRREAVRNLKVLAGIAGLHRSLASEAAEPPTLDHWGRLKVLERIGRGSFGDVYRAWDTKLDREVALKLLRTDSGHHEGAAVLKEARLLARVRHQNVATVYDADEIGGRVGLWMEFIHGQNLEQILGRRKKLDDSDVTQIGIDLCRALSAVHDAGLIHRDIKAQNVMQAEGGRLVLMDFGTGWELEKAPASVVDAAGTPLYLAPEIFDGAQANAQSDIYSTGVLLFHLRTGEYPVRGASIKEVQQAHARSERTALASAAPGVRRALAAVVDRAIQTDPSKRFESAGEMGAALESVQRESGTRHRRRTWLGVSAAALLAVAFITVSSVRRRESGPNGQSPGARSAYFGSIAQRRAIPTPQYMIMGIPSPDGRFLPYSEMETGNLALYEFATGKSRTLTTGGEGGNENYATASIVSADSSLIAYSWEEGTCSCTQLRVIGAGGEGERILHGRPDAAEIRPLQWSLDGRRILGTRRQGDHKTDVVLVSALDGSVRAVLSVPEVLGRVTLSPDDRYIAYDRTEDARDSDHGIYLFATDGGPEIPVATGPSYDSDPMWTADGSGLVFASTRTGGPGLWLQSIKNGRTAGPPRLLDKDMGPFSPVTLTRQGSLFYDHRTGLMDVYTAEIDPATGEVTGEPTNAAKQVLGSNVSADWSPDGDTISFASWRPTGRNILVFRSIKTGAERELQLDLGIVSGARWSPDGRSLAVGGRDRHGVRGLRLIDPASGNVVSTVPLEYTSLAWDPDGIHAYVNHYPKSVSRIDVRTGEEEVLYEPPSYSVPGSLSLSPDGRWLALGIYLRQAKSSKIILIPTAGGLTRSLLDVPDAQGTIAVGDWTRDGKRLVFTKTTRDSEKRHVGDLWDVPLDGGPPHRLGLSMHALRDVRVSPDGTRISFTSGYPDTDLWVFENFLPRADVSWGLTRRHPDQGIAGIGAPVRIPSRSLISVRQLRENPSNTSLR